MFDLADERPIQGWTFGFAYIGFGFAYKDFGFAYKMKLSHRRTKIV